MSCGAAAPLDLPLLAAGVAVLDCYFFAAVDFALGVDLRSSTTGSAALVDFRRDAEATCLETVFPSFVFIFFSTVLLVVCFVSLADISGLVIWAAVRFFPTPLCLVA